MTTENYNVGDVDAIYVIDLRVKELEKESFCGVAMNNFQEKRRKIKFSNFAVIINFQKRAGRCKLQFFINDFYKSTKSKFQLSFNIYFD